MIKANIIRSIFILIGEVIVFFLVIFRYQGPADNMAAGLVGLGAGLVAPTLGFIGGIIFLKGGLINKLIWSFVPVIGFFSLLSLLGRYSS